MTKSRMEEYLNFIKNSKKYPDYWAPLYILFHTGIRISEFCGLTIKDVDFQNKTISINKQLRADKNGVTYIETPKSDSDNRIIPMTDDVAECFKTLATEARKRKYQTLIDGVGGFFCYTKKQFGHGA